jgi:mono/diheme cytochrome c family protein
MRRLVGWSAGLSLVGLVLLLGVVRGAGISAKREPWPLEERVTKSAWRFLIPSEMRRAANPVANTAENIQGGLEHFADHCAVCHGNDGSGDTTIGRRIFPPAPDMREARTQRLSDGELFYAIERGIPWTAMPGWEEGTAEGAQASWKLVLFIRHLPALTPAERTHMETLNPKSAAERASQGEVEGSLPGTTSPVPKKSGHIHKSP